MTLIISGDITLRRTWQPMDPDAAAYITAVETADGQALEEPVKIAIDNFVLGCKADGIWNAIKASCILAGARTLNGALVPLAGTAPTNFNFVAGDYNRKTGLAGDGSTKYLSSNRANNADPQNSSHMSCYVTEHPTGDFDVFLGSDVGSVAGGNMMQAGGLGNGTRNDMLLQSRSLLSAPLTGLAALTGFKGISRSLASSFDYRLNALAGTVSAASNAPTSAIIGVFVTRLTNLAGHSNARLAFYSIGQSLDLALLDARVTDLINKFEEVIP